MNTDQINNALRRSLAKNAVHIAGDSKPVTEPKVRIDNGPLLRSTGLKIVHINRRDFGDRSMTIAFKGTRSLVEIATSVTHPSDTFCKKIGTQKAVEAFQAGKTIRVPIPRVWGNGPLSSYIIALFSVI